MEIERIFFCIGLIACLGDFIIPAILGRKYPNYSIVKDTISTLGTKDSPVKKKLSLWLIILGVLFLGFSIGHVLVSSDYSWRYIMYLVGIILFGLGSILSGIFAEDPKGVEETPSGKIHGISSGLGFLLLLLNPLWMSGITENSTLKLFNIIFFILGILSFTLFLISEDKKGFIGLTGLWQRINLTTLYVPLILNYFILTS